MESLHVSSPLYYFLRRRLLINFSIYSKMNANLKFESREVSPGRKFSLLIYSHANSFNYAKQNKSHTFHTPSYWDQQYAFALMQKGKSEREREIKKEKTNKKFNIKGAKNRRRQCFNTKLIK